MAGKASENYKVYENPGGPKVSTVARRIIEKDGLYFKDIDGTGEVSKVNDWRLPAAERAKAYAETLSVEEKIGQLFISDWRMGKYPTPLAMGSTEIPEYTLDESGTLDEAEHTVKNIFGEQYIPGTSTLEQLVLTDETLNRAVARTLQGMFELGLFEDTYRDPKLAVEVASTQADWDKAMDAHRKSVTLLKNDGTLPLTKDKMSGRKVYAEAFHQSSEKAGELTKGLKEMLLDVTLVDNGLTY